MIKFLEPYGSDNRATINKLINRTNEYKTFLEHVTTRTDHEVIMCQIKSNENENEAQENEVHRTSIHASLDRVFSAVDELKKRLEQAGYICITDSESKHNSVAKDDQTPGDYFIVLED